VTKKKDKSESYEWVRIPGYYQSLKAVRNKLNAMRIRDVIGDFSKLEESEKKFEEMIKGMDDLVLTGKERVVLITKYVHTKEIVETTTNKKGKEKKKVVGTKTTVKVKREEIKKAAPIQKKEKKKEIIEPTPQNEIKTGILDIDGDLF